MVPIKVIEIMNRKRGFIYIFQDNRIKKDNIYN